MIGENFEITGASSGLCPQSGHKPACEEGFTPPSNLPKRYAFIPKYGATGG